MTSKGYSKAKGNGWENQVFRDLRDAIECYKSIGSGNGLDAGDILTHCFCIECKFHKKLTDGEVNKFWLKIVKEAEENHREPILIMKENGRVPQVMFFDKFRGTRRIRMEYPLWLDYIKENAEAMQ
jgi:glutaredoxin